MWFNDGLCSLSTKTQVYELNISLTLNKKVIETYWYRIDIEACVLNICTNHFIEDTRGHLIFVIYLFLDIFCWRLLTKIVSFLPNDISVLFLLKS